MYGTVRKKHQKDHLWYNMVSRAQKTRWAPIEKGRTIQFLKAFLQVFSSWCMNQVNHKRKGRVKIRVSFTQLGNSGVQSYCRITWRGRTERGMKLEIWWEWVSQKTKLHVYQIWLEQSSVHCVCPIATHSTLRLNFFFIQSFLFINNYLTLDP